jgi:hypothetical protein
MASPFSLDGRAIRKADEYFGIAPVPVLGWVMSGGIRARVWWTDMFWELQVLEQKDCCRV